MSTLSHDEKNKVARFARAVTGVSARREHLTVEEVEGFAWERFPETRMEELQIHMGVCPRCLERVEKAIAAREFQAGFQSFLDSLVSPFLELFRPPAHSCASPLLLPNHPTFSAQVERIPEGYRLSVESSNPAQLGQKAEFRAGNQVYAVELKHSYRGRPYGEVIVPDGAIDPEMVKKLLGGE